MKNTAIGWTDDSANPIRRKGGGFYCFKVSPGCTNCYAEGVDKRFNNDTHVPYANMKEYPELELNEKMLASWKDRSKSRKIFVASMTDIFGEFVPDEWVFRILDSMMAAPRQTFQVLTKRNARARYLVNKYCLLRKIDKLPAHIWMVFSVENQKYAAIRVPDLLKTNCTVRGLSLEPLLGEVNLTRIDADYTTDDLCMVNCLTGRQTDMGRPCPDVPNIDWVIVGGESGPGARPMHPLWVKRLRDQCVAAGVPLFFKQWGNYYTKWVNEGTGKAEWEMYHSYEHFTEQARVGKGDICVSFDGRICRSDKDFRECGYPVVIMRRMSKEAAGNLLDGQTYEMFPDLLSK